MTRRNFRTPTQTELKTGLAIWLDGRDFEDTNPINPPNGPGMGTVCGPFLVERVLFRPQPPNERFGQEPRVDLVDPETGRRRSMMSSWLLVPKEEQ